VNLYDIEAGLHEALTVWQEAMDFSLDLSRADALITKAARIEAADLALRTLAELELRKVDGYVAQLRTLQAAMEYRKKEAARHTLAARQIQSALDWLKQFAQGAMEAWGKKRLEGKTGYLLLKGDGGKQAVTITDESLVPEQFMMVSLTYSLKQWAEMGIRPDPKHPRVPVLSLIAEALNQPCPDCAGKGGPVDLTAYGGGDNEPCPTCDGTGKQSVPGARLQDRGQHVEIK
jgi:Siphovirus Gp157